LHFVYGTSPSHSNLPASFCPAEGKILKECLDGGWPGKNSENIPLRCAMAWLRFDRCLIKKTREVEDSQNGPNVESMDSILKEIGKDEK
jgi:hypothetical protein